MKDTFEDVERFVTALESRVKSGGELVLASVQWPTGDHTPDFDRTDVYRGMTLEFKGLVKSVCHTPEDWSRLQLELQALFANASGPHFERLEAIGDSLWMQSHFDDLCVWHTAFPPLDGGGASMVRTVRRLFAELPARSRRRYFEWCCGPGFLGFDALHNGLCEELVLADLNPRVLQGILRTVRENGFEGRVRFYLSDNLKGVPKDERFDVVVGNPPWAYREISGLANPLIPNDPGWRLHRDFFREIKAYLTDEAEIIVSCFRPYEAVAYIEEMSEPWDVRPRPPVQDFRAFMEEGGLVLDGVRKPNPDPIAEFSKGFAFLIARAGGKIGDLGLLGLGGNEPDEAESQEVPRLEEYRFLLDPEPLEGHRRYQALQYVVGANLAVKSLSTVVKELFADNEIDHGLMQSFGVPEKIVSHFAEAREECGLESGFQLVEETPFRQVNRVRVQLTQDAPVCVGLKALFALLKAFGDRLSVVATIKPGADLDPLAQLIHQEVGATCAGAVSFLRQGHQTLFAQDSAKLVRNELSQTALWVPKQGSSHRSADQMQPGFLPLVPSALNWEGGNLLCDGYRLVVGANSVASSMRALGLTEDEVLKVFAAESGYRPLVLGSVEGALHSAERAESGFKVSHAVDGGQADFHLDVDCCLIGREKEVGEPVALLADPEGGLAYLKDILDRADLFEDHFLSPDRARSLYQLLLDRTLERRVELLNLYHRQLRAEGYRIVRLPDLRLCSDFNYLARKNLFFGYCNAFVFRDQSRPTAALFPLGLPSLEEEVERRYSELGVSVAWVGDPILGEEMASMRGGLHCFCSVVG